MADALGLQVQAQAKKEMVLWNGIECSVEFPIQTYAGEGLKVLAETAGGKTCSLVKSIGRGKCLAYGFPLSHVFDYQVQTVGGWMKELGITRQIDVSPWDVHAVARWGKDRGFLFLFNYHDYPKKGKVTLRNPGSFKGVFTQNFQMPRRSAKIVPLKMKGSKIMEVN